MSAREDEASEGDVTVPVFHRSERGAHLDYFGARPTCGCITAWLASDSSDDEVIEFARRMKATGRDVIRLELTDEIRAKLVRCPHLAVPDEDCAHGYKAAGGTTACPACEGGYVA